MTAVGLNQTVLANTANDIGLSAHSSLLPSVTQNAGQQSTAPMILAAGVDTRVERRHDAVDNTADRVDDKQDFREERRDCVGDGPDLCARSLLRVGDGMAVQKKLVCEVNNESYR